MLVKLLYLYDGPPLADDPAPMIVLEVTMLDLIPLKVGVVVYRLGILLILGGAGLFDRLTRVWPISSSVITLHILLHNLWLGLGVLSLL
jgi:hypothetical protein